MSIEIAGRIVSLAFVWLLAVPAHAQSVTPEQHRFLMSSVNELNGAASYRKHSGAHGAIAVCIKSPASSTFDGGTFQASNDGGGLNFCNFQSNSKTLECLTLTLNGVQTADVASLKSAVMDACRSNEKTGSCHCVLADVDGELP